MGDVLPGPLGQQCQVGKAREHPVLGPDRGNQQQGAGCKRPASTSGDSAHQHSQEGINEEDRRRIHCTGLGFADMEAGERQQGCRRPGNGRLPRHQHQGYQPHQHHGQGTRDGRKIPRNHEMVRTVAVGLDQTGVSGNAGTGPLVQPRGDGDSLAPDEGSVFKSAQGSPAGACFIKIHQGEAAGAIPAPTHCIGTVQTGQQRQHKQQ